jgi:hypothetical protein
MNLMTAGRGIAHSERSPLSARQGSEGLFGIQSWIALPQAQEETDPSFQHFEAARLPTIEDDGVRARVIAGSTFGIKSPVGTLSARAKELEKNAHEWWLLLQVDSDDRASMMWADLGRVYFWIREEDLRERRFERAWAILQCG